MWNWLKLSGGIVPNKPTKSNIPVEKEVFSSDWNWLTYVVIHKPSNKFMFEVKHKLITPTGNWMIETKFSGEQTLFIEGKDRDDKVEYYNEHFIRLVAESQKVYNKS